MSNNLQLFIFLALGLLVSVLAAREVRRVFRSREPKGHAELAAEQLAYAQRQYLLHRAQAEEHAATADMFSEQADRLRSYCALYPVPMVMTWKHSRDLKSMITPDGPKVVKADTWQSTLDTSKQQTSGDMQYLPHEALRKTWSLGQRWQFRPVGANCDWLPIHPSMEPAWEEKYEYRKVPE